MFAGLRHVIRRHAERLFWPGGRAAILLYHRVAEGDSGPYGLCVTPLQFEEHLQALRSIGQPMPLSDLARTVQAGSVPERAIAITFDDGYLDNAESALPLLEKYDVPATIFATTGRGGREREFWWDELERIFFQPGTLPETLELRLGDTLHQWAFGADADYTRSDMEAHRYWHLLSDEAPTARHAAFRETYHLVNPLPEKERTAVMDLLGAWAKQETLGVRPSRRTMNPAHMAEVDAGGLVRIEAHTANHLSLPTQTDEVQRAEIEESKHTLEKWLGRPVTGFAYPYGAYDDRAVAAVRGAGFEFACACTYRAAWSRSDRFALPRLEAPACDGDTLIEMLQWQLL